MEKIIEASVVLRIRYKIVMAIPYITPLPKIAAMCDPGTLSSKG